jgi:hypothetical protein
MALVFRILLRDNMLQKRISVYVVSPKDRSNRLTVELDQRHKDHNVQCMSHINVQSTDNIDRGLNFNTKCHLFSEQVKKRKEWEVKSAMNDFRSILVISVSYLKIYEVLSVTDFNMVLVGPIIQTFI